MLLNVTEFKYLGKALMNKDCVCEEMKTTLNWGMFVAAQSNIFCLTGCYKGTWQFKYTKI
jgi:hypothetical protein